MATAETAGAGAPLERFGHVIAGAEVFPGGGSTFVSVNPTTGKAWAEFPLGDATTIDEAVGAAAAAFEDPRWAGLSATRRGRLLMRWGDAIAANAERIGRLECTQNGKLPAEMVLQGKI